MHIIYILWRVFISSRLLFQRFILEHIANYKEGKDEEEILKDIK